ncbi:hypothetical protein BBK82_35935 [Lentzea guizhouensis]|uniref:Peptidase C39-like domain-containing protein n=1 Tax=Lentzea guizhouensis TaxID=1586287 RepID=A0A1B2HS63_9PSEU|nr:hypothetical protein [Lentzea guizhouensis]ANZ40596.1 hypothetical protein BBK82_35935 [Lentzea guizhouensis]
MLRKVVIATIATAAVSSVALPGLAAADPIIGTPPPCVKLADITGPDFEVKQCGVSDVDQYRAGFAANGGTHCGPSSLYNVLHYWGHEKQAPVGWLTTKVRNLDPRNPADYGIVTNSIGRIATDSKWSVEDGTYSGNLRTAWNIATKPARDAGWSTATGGISTTAGPDFAGDLAKKLSQGPVQMWYGRYVAGPQNSLKRDGGHLVTVVSAKGSFGGDFVQLRLADPAEAADHGKPGYLDTQSAYETLAVTLTRRSVYEYLPVKDDEATPADESLQPGTYRSVERWELSGTAYADQNKPLVEGFNWFTMSPPVG